MNIQIFQIDAFTENTFGGNPAAVCPLEEWLSDKQMQLIAMENNLAETVFYVKNENVFDIRWFTPTTEVDLCGHATLAAAYVILNFGNHNGDTVNFYSHRSGNLSVTRNNDLLTLNFPSDTFEEVEIPDQIIESFHIKPITALKGKTDYILVFDSQEDITNFVPDFVTIATLDSRGVIITAPGKDVDFVSRFFAPQSGIPEDPVTGSAHTSLIPYWSEKLGKTELTARQLSQRQGYLYCKNLGDRVEISGNASLYMSGTIFMD